MLSNLVSIYSETPSLTVLSARILLKEFSDMIRSHETALFQRRHTSLIYVPVNSVKQAAELSLQGGLLIWLTTSIRHTPAKSLKPTVAIRGVNTVSACRRAIQIAGNHVITEDQIDTLTLVMLPDCTRASKNRNQIV
jgi:hypothetical protein